MQLLELTLESPQANLALDEALLETIEEESSHRELLRIWEAPTPMVVVGRSTKIDEEVDRARCEELGIPVLRRASGGATIVAGPGCLMYAAVLSHAQRPQLALLDAAHRTVLEPLANELALHLPGVVWAGTSDLVWRDRKFSGNSLRCKRQHLVYHGTLLYDFPLDLVGQLLRTPPRQPAYRAGRSHGDFIGNLPLKRETLRLAIISAFGALDVTGNWPRQRTAQLIAEKYSQPSWNARL
jgi:lipoate-protein ligase A